MSSSRTISCDLLIVGGGAAGMSAALAASQDRNVRVTVIDNNPRLGGQIWRAELGKTKSPHAKSLIEAIETRRIEVVRNAQVFAAPHANNLLAVTPTTTMSFDYRSLIIATGARERFLPFPGWTLPNVFGAGGLQAMVKGGLKIEEKRIVVAGTGPLLLAVADYFRSKGANVIAIVEQASARSINRFARQLWTSPTKLIQAAGLKKRIFRVPYLTDSWVVNAKGVGEHNSKGIPNRLGPCSLSLTISRNGGPETLDCDYLACGFHLVPNNELASLLGCGTEDGFVRVDDLQRTSISNIYCAGEPTGIGGVESSLVEGTIAGHAAAGDGRRAQRWFGKRDKTRRFSDALNEAFDLRSELKNLAEPETVVCRCEDVQYGKLAAFDDWRTAKLQTRCGMGPCQGRVCGSAVEFIFDWKPESVRPPIFPVRLENL